MQALQMPKNRGELRKLAQAVPAPADKPTVDELAVLQAWFEPIWLQICANCPGWKAAIPDGGADVIARTWFEALASRRGALGDEAIRRGLLALQGKRLTWLPHPLDFVDMCLPVGGGIPTLDAARFEIESGKRPWSCDFIAHLAAETGALLHPSTAKAARDVGFRLEYEKAQELAKTGFFEQGSTKRLEQQPMDENQRFALYLFRAFPDADFGAEFVEDCRKRGIFVGLF